MKYASEFLLYLGSTEAAQAVGRLFAPDPPIAGRIPNPDDPEAAAFEDDTPEVKDGDFVWRLLQGCDQSWSFPAWKRVSLQYKIGEFVQCYVRADGSPLVASDCGETVSRLMLQNGRRWEENVRIAKERTPLIGGTNAGDIRSVGPVSEQAPIVISVLAAIAKVLAQA